ncbi:hypothetical protein KUCAC02_032734 [Chaenocephalus aceratus]|nr:hypothetical protein KUCAC02_032734 [Chaenocephalus aceratus]
MSTNEVVLEVQFHPTDPHTIVTCGKSHIFFWTWSGTSLARKQGIFGKYEKPKFIQCLVFLSCGDILTGDSGGVLLVWTRSASETPPPSKGPRAFQISRQVKAHEGSVFCVCETRSGSLLTGGGKDRKIILWDQEVPDQYGTIRAVSEGKGDEILVGTSRNFILRGTFNDGFLVEVQGHTDELWGLASHPSRGMFLTCAQDRLVCLWSAEEHRLQWSRSLEEHGHYTTDLVSIHTDGNEQLSVMRFSVDGVLLAVGSHDNLIYLYTVSERGRKYSRYGSARDIRATSHTWDWSPDNNFIMSNSGDYEILYWDVQTAYTSYPCTQYTLYPVHSVTPLYPCTQHTSIPVHSAHLYTRALSNTSIPCTQYTYYLYTRALSVWPEGSDGTDINALIRSHKRKVIALADDFCKVHLFAYPCSTPKAPSHKYSAHSSHVTNVSFLYNDSHLVSTGGKDTSIMQWRLVERPALSLPDGQLSNSAPDFIPPPLSVTTPTQEPISAPTAQWDPGPLPRQPAPPQL